MSDETVIVSGATGFLGGAVTRHLLQARVPVLALGRNVDALEQLRELGALTLAVDLERRMRSSMGPARAFVHCAALSSPWGALADFRRANVVATANALAAARASGVRRFVHISTPSVYFRFQDQWRVPEDAALPPPVNAYALTKREAEDLVKQATDLDTIILRPRGLYGAGDSALLPRLAKAASRGPLPLLREGRAETDLTHVDDAVAAVMASLSAPPHASGRVFNVSGGQALRLVDVVEAVCGRLSVSVRWRPLPISIALAAARVAEAFCARLPGRPEPAVTAYGLGVMGYSQTLDITAVAEGLGWRPRIGFAEGLDRTLHGLN